MLQLIDEPLPPCPVEVTVVPHWLAINGVQPAVPENAAAGRPPKRAKTVPPSAHIGPKIQAPTAAPAAAADKVEKEATAKGRVAMACCR